MKKLLLTLLTILFSFSLNARDFSYEYEGKIVIYTVIDEDAKTCMTKEGGYDKSLSITHAEYKAGNYVSGDLILPKNPIDNNIVYTLISLGKYAFYDCGSLKSVSIPDGVTTIGTAAFQNCDNLETVSIPESVTNIGSEAFSFCSCLKNVSIPNGVTSIYVDTFYNCNNLRSVIIPNTISSIGSFAFSLCKNLESIIIPENANVYDYAFSQSGIRTLTISKGVTIEGENVFKECTGITKIYCKENVPLRLYRNLFPTSVYDKATLFVPIGSSRAYRNTIPWSFFLNIIDYKFDSGIENILVTKSSSSIDLTLPYEIFNLSGMQIDISYENLNHGIYIIRQGDTVKKIVVK